MTDEMPTPPTGTSRVGGAAPSDVPGSVAFLLMALGRRVRERVDGELRDLGLAYRHLSVLGHLRGRPDVSYSELARRAGVTPQSMQATVLRLEDDGAIERTTDPGRGRSSRLRLTDRGHELLAAGTAVVARVEADLLGELPAEQRRSLADALMGIARDVLTDGRPPRRTGSP